MNKTSENIIQSRHRAFLCKQRIIRFSGRIDGRCLHNGLDIWLAEVEAWIVYVEFSMNFHWRVIFLSLFLSFSPTPSLLSCYATCIVYIRFHSVFVLNHGRWMIIFLLFFFFNSMWIVKNCWKPCICVMLMGLRKYIYHVMYIYIYIRSLHVQCSIQLLRTDKIVRHTKQIWCDTCTIAFFEHFSDSR